MQRCPNSVTPSGFLLTVRHFAEQDKAILFDFNDFPLENQLHSSLPPAFNAARRKTARAHGVSPLYL